LADTVPAAIAVREYWRTADPESLGPEPELWKPAQHHSAEHPVYLGPGGLLLSFGKQVVVVSALARWSGFLTIEPLRIVHLSAFRSIARCVRGTRLLLLPDAMDEGYDAINGALSQEECAARLQKKYGLPQPSVTAIPPNAFTAPIPGSHLVWFNEPL
jgi:hypothetical protein